MSLTLTDFMPYALNNHNRLIVGDNKNGLISIKRGFLNRMVEILHPEPKKEKEDKNNEVFLCLKKALIEEYDSNRLVDEVMSTFNPKKTLSCRKIKLITERAKQKENKVKEIKKHNEAFSIYYPQMKKYHPVNNDLILQISLDLDSNKNKYNRKAEHELKVIIGNSNKAIELLSKTKLDNNAIDSYIEKIQLQIVLLNTDSFNLSSSVSIRESDFDKEKIKALKADINNQVVMLRNLKDYLYNLKNYFKNFSGAIIKNKNIHRDTACSLISDLIDENKNDYKKNQAVINELIMLRRFIKQEKNIYCLDDDILKNKSSVDEGDIQHHLVDYYKQLLKRIVLTGVNKEWLEERYFLIYSQELNRQFLNNTIGEIKPIDDNILKYYKSIETPVGRLKVVDDPLLAKKIFSEDDHQAIMKQIIYGFCNEKNSIQSELKLIERNINEVNILLLQFPQDIPAMDRQIKKIQSHIMQLNIDKLNLSISFRIKKVDFDRKKIQALEMEVKNKIMMLRERKFYLENIIINSKSFVESLLDTKNLNRDAACALITDIVDEKKENYKKNQDEINNLIMLRSFIKQEKKYYSDDDTLKKKSSIDGKDIEYHLVSYREQLLKKMVNWGVSAKWLEENYFLAHAKKMNQRPWGTITNLDAAILTDDKKTQTPPADMELMTDEISPGGVFAKNYTGHGTQSKSGLKSCSAHDQVNIDRARESILLRLSLKPELMQQALDGEIIQIKISPAFLLMLNGSHNDVKQQTAVLAALCKEKDQPVLLELVDDFGKKYQIKINLEDEFSNLEAKNPSRFLGSRHAAKKFNNKGMEILFGRSIKYKTL